MTDIAECDVPTGAGGRRRRFAVSGFSPRGNQVLIQFFSSTHDAQLFEQRYVEPGEKGVRVCNVVIGFNDHDAFVDRVVSCLRKRCG